MYDIVELNGKLVADLRQIAKDLGIPKAEKLLKNWPTFSLKQWRVTNLRFKDETVNERIIDYARKAGLPD